jgi:hypothetical protein
MTDHAKWDELAAGHALHALDPAEQAEFDAHLETCAECVAQLDDHEFVAAQLGSISHFPDTDEAPSWESIRPSIVGERAAGATVTDLAARRRYTGLRRSLAAAAAVVVLAGDAGSRTLASVTVRANRVTVTPTDMPAAPAGKVYVLWQLPRNGRATPVAAFAGGKGAKPTTDSLRAAYSQTAAFAVSLESAGPPPPMPSNTLASGTAT